MSTLAALAAVPGGPHHHRFMERSLLAMHEPLTPPPPPAAPSLFPRKPSHEKDSANSTPSATLGSQEETPDTLREEQFALPEAGH